MGTLAGSTIMLLTIAWGGSLLAGRCDLNERVRGLSPRPSQRSSPQPCLTTWCCVPAVVTSQRSQCCALSVCLSAQSVSPAAFANVTAQPMLCTSSCAIFCVHEPPAVMNRGSHFVRGIRPPSAVCACVWCMPTGHWRLPRPANDLRSGALGCRREWPSTRS